MAVIDIMIYALGFITEQYQIMPKKFDASKRRKLMDIKLVSGITMPQNKKGGHQNALE
jgi:hypothetical protein